MTEQIDYRYDVFISYSHADREWVWNTLLPLLEAAELSICNVQSDSPSLVNFKHSLYILIVLTPDWITSEWEDFERLLDDTADPAARRGKLRLVRLRPCKIPTRLTTLGYTNLTQRNPQEDQLIEHLKSSLKEWQHQKQLLDIHRDNLQKLERKAAYYVIDIPTHIENEIEKEKGEISKIEAKLHLLGEDWHSNRISEESDQYKARAVGSPQSTTAIAKDTSNPAQKLRHIEDPPAPPDSVGSSEIHINSPKMQPSTRLSDYTSRETAKEPEQKRDWLLPIWHKHRNTIIRIVSVIIVTLFSQGSSQPPDPQLTPIATQPAVATSAPAPTITATPAPTAISDTAVIGSTPEPSITATPAPTAISDTSETPTINCQDGFQAPTVLVGIHPRAVRINATAQVTMKVLDSQGTPVPLIAELLYAQAGRLEQRHPGDYTYYAPAFVYSDTITADVDDGHCKIQQPLKVSILK